MELRELMLKTYTKYSGFTSWSSVNTDEELPSYGNGAGWGPSMMKLDYLRKMLEWFPVKDDDFILSVDSDVVFTSPEVFKYVKPDYGIIGIKHKPDFETLRGPWSHMSGALIFIRVDIAKQMCAMSGDILEQIRYRHFKPFSITENEDVVLSYLAWMAGANYFDLGTVPDLSSGNFEGDVIKDTLYPDEHCDNPVCCCQSIGNGKGIQCSARHLIKRSHLKSFYHLNYCPTQFLGEPVSGKWDIARVLKQKGIEL